MDINSYTEDDIVSMPSDKLACIVEEVNTRLKEAKDNKNTLDKYLAIRYTDKAREILAMSGRGSGTAHFRDQFILVKTTIPKKVTWDQQKLAGLEDRCGIIASESKINENKYKSLTPDERAYYDQAREVKEGKATFELKEI